MCKKSWGYLKYDRHMRNNFKDHGRSRIVCTTCTKETDEKVKLLRKRFKLSKRWCKCNCPIHQEKCPLAPVYYKEKRWPGSDIATDGQMYITEADYRFLEALKPRPDWWSKALGKREM